MSRIGSRDDTKFSSKLRGTFNEPMSSRSKMLVKETKDIEAKLASLRGAMALEKQKRESLWCVRVRACRDADSLARTRSCTSFVGVWSCENESR